MDPTQQSERCAVCGDKPTGTHYGAVSCDGCKGFFKRSVEQDDAPMYECRYRQCCWIDVSSRNKCRACRFEKCLKAGMRVLTSKGASPELQEASQVSNQPNSEAYSAFLDSRAMSLISNPCEQRPDIVRELTLTELTIALSFARADFFAEVYPTPLPCTLGANDRGTLMEANLAKRLVVDILQRSLGKPFFDVGNGFHYYPTEAPADNWLAPIFNSFYPTMYQMNELEVSEREFAYFRALTLLDSTGVPGVKDKETVDLMRVHLMEMLRKEECDAQPQEGSRRFATLIMLVRSISIMAKKFHDFLCQHGAYSTFWTLVRVNPDAQSTQI